jgi:6,7-dimethyl-8-ribityllumazine synthase
VSGSGGPTIGVRADGLRVAIAASSWHDTVMDGLIAGALRACEAGHADATVIRVAGSFELPVVAQACAESGRYDAVVCLGVIIRGGTPHFEFVANATTDGLGRRSGSGSSPATTSSRRWIAPGCPARARTRARRPRGPR